MKKFEILNRETLDHFITRIVQEYDDDLIDGIEFKKINVVIKAWRKDKTPRQHRFFWVCIGEMRKGFNNIGYEYNNEQISEFVKKECGYCDNNFLPNGVAVSMVKSISDKSEHVDAKIMNEMIEFIIRFSAENLDIIIQDPRTQ